jgi:hypothetical protein
MLIVRWLINTLAVLIAAYLIPNISVANWWVAMWLVLFLGNFNTDSPASTPHYNGYSSLETMFPNKNQWSINSVVIRQPFRLADMGDKKGFAAEDSVIEKIAKDKKITIQIGPTADVQFEVGNMTNCAKLSGNGPIKVVFMRGKSWNGGVSSYLGRVQEVIEGFASIEPLAKYIDQFSFYIDLKKHDDTSWPTEVTIKNTTPYGGITYDDIVMYKESAAKTIGSQSSCGGNADQYFFYFSKDQHYIAYSILAGKISLINLGTMVVIGGNIKNSFNGDVHATKYEAVHEFAHSFAGLFDEYISSIFGSIRNTMTSAGTFSGENCSGFPTRDYRSSLDNKRYGIAIPGCTYITNGDIRSPDYRRYYRPSSASIMNDTPSNPDELNKFNVVSCGYVIAAIKKEPLTKSNAQKYWPECMKMDTIKDGIPTVNPAPRIGTAVTSFNTSNSLGSSLAEVMNVLDPRSLLAEVSSIFSTTIKPGFKVTITGSGFTPEDNAVQFTDKKTGQIYEVLEIPGVNNGTTISFYAPTSTPPGNYTMKAGAFNSPWSNTIDVVVARSVAPTLELTAKSTQNTNGGQSVPISWISQGASGCVSNSSVTTGLPSVWTSPEREGTFLFTPPTAGNHTFSMTCSGTGGTVTKSLIIQSGSPSQTLPKISLASLPASINAGEGVTVTWSAPNVASCTRVGTGDMSIVSPWMATSSLSGTLYGRPYTTTTLTLSCLSSSNLRATSTLVIPVRQTLASSKVSVTCSASPSYGPGVAYNELVTFTAMASGGDGTYQYVWSGSDGLSGTTKVRSVYYPSTVSVGTKSARVQVTSLGTSTIATCDGVFVNKFKATPTGGALDMSTSLSPSAGMNGTRVIISALRYNDFPNFNPGFGPATMVVLEKDGVKTYIKPADVQNSNSTGQKYVAFDVQLPSSAPTGAYSVYLQQWNGSSFVKSNQLTFTYTGLTPTPVPIDTSPVPTINSLSPTTGPLNTMVTVTGNPITTQSTIILKHLGTSRVVKPTTYTSISGTYGSVTFPLTMYSVPAQASGEYEVSVSTGSQTSIPSKFTVTTAKPQISLVTSANRARGGDSVRVTWSILGADLNQCSANFARLTSLAGSVDVVLANRNASGLFSVTCTGPGGYAEQKAQVTVADAQAPVLVPETPAVVTPTVTPIQEQIVPSVAPQSVPLTPAAVTPPTILPWSGPSSIQVGQTLNFTLNWSGGPYPLSPSGQSWTIFVHLRKTDWNNDWSKVIGADFSPSTPTAQWISGTYATPSSKLIPANALPGTYDVIVGMYVGSNSLSLTAGSGVQTVSTNTYKVGQISITDVPAPIQAPAQGSDLEANVVDALLQWLMKWGIVR